MKPRKHRVLRRCSVISNEPHNGHSELFALSNEPGRVGYFKKPVLFVYAGAPVQRHLRLIGHPTSACVRSNKSPFVSQAFPPVVVEGALLLVLLDDGLLRVHLVSVMGIPIEAFRKTPKRLYSDETLPGLGAGPSGGKRRNEVMPYQT